MHISTVGLQLVRHFEGCRLTAYPDPATGDEPWTIGVGHTGKDVHKGLTITSERADELLASDMLRFQSGVTRLVGDIPQCQYDALCSFSFNVGLGNLEKSTLLKKLRAGDIAGAADQFLVWNKAAGKVMAGLTKRRKAERALFLNQDWRTA